jgi:RHS repeat-associated protein
MNYARNPSPLAARNRSPIRNRNRIPDRIRCPSQSLKPYNRSHMHLASSPVFPEPPTAALRLLGEKPHQGVRRKNPAPYPGHNRCKLRTALGLREGQRQNRVRSCCSGEQYDPDLGLYDLRARYMNPATGRFLNRDPEDGWADYPASLHKYLYGSGDPVNRIDPSGRADTVDEDFLYKFVLNATAALITYKAAVVCLYGWDTTNFTSTVDTGLYGGYKQQVAPCVWLWDMAKKVPIRRRKPQPIPLPTTPPGNKFGCSPSDLRTCQIVYPLCVGPNCDTCLINCRVNCEWPFEICNKFIEPSDPGGLPWKMPSGGRLQ